ncbi:MAG: zinc-binding alcohol dehydrogenase family protein [Cyclobacteriaceae bacterium]|nr:zinc-binding alcohol dehydrogenase family protein [Cyclobacteriaceae bacterium]
MNYIICEQPNQFFIKTKATPALEPECALLQIKRIGICGTDLHAYKGEQAFFTYPRILGHELAAEILAVDGNDELKVRDRVAVIPYINCKECSACCTGKSNCCEHLKVYGVHMDGGMQEVINFPTRLLLPANDLSFDDIALVEPLAVGAHALRRAHIQKGKTIVVLGCGPIGMGIIQLAKILGVTVFAIDVNEHRLTLAKEKFGADHILKPSPKMFRKINQDELAHTVFDATGNRQAIESGLEYMGHGGTLVLVGLTKGELTFHHPSLHAKETTLMSSRNATREDFEFVLNVLRKKKFNTEAYITRNVSYHSILTEFDAWSTPDSKEIKVVTRWE